MSNSRSSSSPSQPNKPIKRAVDLVFPPPTSQSSSPKPLLLRSNTNPDLSAVPESVTVGPTSNPKPAPSTPDLRSPRHLRRASTFKVPIRIATGPSFAKPTTSSNSPTETRTRATSLTDSPPEQNRISHHKPSLSEVASIRKSGRETPIDRTPSKTNISPTPTASSDSSPVQPLRPTPLTSSNTNSADMSSQQKNAPVEAMQAYPQYSGPVAAQQSGKVAMSLPMPGLSGQANSAVGNLLRGPVDANGKLKDAALTVGIKLDLEAEVHLTARVRGDILVGLY